MQIFPGRLTEEQQVVGSPLIRFPSSQASERDRSPCPVTQALFLWELLWLSPPLYPKVAREWGGSEELGSWSPLD